MLLYKIYIKCLFFTCICEKWVSKFTCITDMIRFYVNMVNSQFLWRYLKNKTHMKSKTIPVHWKSKDNDYFTYVFKSRKRVQHNYHTYDADFWSFSEKKEDTIAWKKSFWLEYYLKRKLFSKYVFPRKWLVINYKKSSLMNLAFVFSTEMIVL